MLFDVDFTLSRPGPELGPDGFWETGERHGLELARDRYEEAHAAALVSAHNASSHEHDEEVWIRFTERVLIGMGADPTRSRPAAVDLVGEWGCHENFDLYDDALPALDDLRRRGLKLGLVTNGHRDIDEFVVHHGLQVDVAVGSKAHGLMKPHPSIFEVALAALGVAATEAAMVGDSPDHDVAGARAIGMRGVLLDRDGRYPPGVDVVADLYALPSLLGLEA